MSTTAIVIIAAIVLVAIALLATQGGGPRVTHIETRREKEDRKDDDA